jgi:hypothetical protein
MAQPSWEDLESTIVATITEEDGVDTDVELHPGALLVGWQHYGETQLALPGIQPGRRFSTIAVVSDDDPPEKVDPELGIDAAIDYATQHYPSLQGQPVLAYVASDESGIRSALEAAAQDMANQSFVEGLSTPGDELIDALTEEGYDPESVVVIASSGAAVAVNGDLHVDSHWEQKLGLVDKFKPYPELWTDDYYRRDHFPRTALAYLQEWLVNEGFTRRTDLGGEWPGGAEQEIDKDFLVEHAASASRIPEAEVRELADAWKGQQVYWTAESGDTTVWAQKKRRPKKARKR